MNKNTHFHRKICVFETRIGDSVLDWSLSCCFHFLIPKLEDVR
uniref:Uncharacterized protein n=1 Tax=Rhizophora mucronata TaxID=61149 RepID=A0A2P2QHY8_RHIMU